MSLTGKLVTLRALTVEDVKELSPLFDDLRTHSIGSKAPPRPDKVAREIVSINRDEPATPTTAVHFAVLSSFNGELVGRCEVGGLDLQHRSCVRAPQTASLT